MTINSVSPLRADISQLLNRMHEVAAKIDLPANKTNQVNTEIKATGFANYLHEAMNHVSQSQKTAEDLATAYERGDSGVDIAQTSVAMARARVEFSAAVAVRNSFTNAYHEIFNMPV